MAKRVQCPHCHEEFFPGECNIIAKVPYKTKQLDINPGDVLKRPSSLAWIHAEPLTGSLYTLTRAVRQCPNCDKDWPPNIDTVKSYTIAIVGDSFSGKTHYIASCIRQLLKAPALQVIGCSAIIGQGQTDTIYNNDYYAPVYIAKKKVGNTIAGRITEPLIYELVFPGKSVNLLFYDASGEDMMNPDQMVLYSNYILNASAIIFLADPMAMDSILQSIPDHIKAQQPLRTISPAQALNRIITTFKQKNRIGPKNKVRTPIAITISKSDLLDFTEKTTNLPLYLRDNVLANRLDTNMFDVISGQVQNMLMRHGDSVLLRTSQMFENVSFFAVSATGWAADDQEEFRVIEPRRCLDPLLWALWRLGIIYDG